MKKMILKGKSPEELRRTLSWISDATEYDYMATQELAGALRELHDSFGDSPNDLVLDLEVTLTKKCEERGLTNRYEDELSKQAGTYKEAPPAPSLYEVEIYMGTVGLNRDAVRLVKMIDDESGTVYVDVASPLLQPIKGDIIRAFQRTMPPRLELKDLSTAPAGGFVEKASTHMLNLTSYMGDFGVETSTYEHMTKVHEEAIKACKVFKDAGGPLINVRLVKDAGMKMERIVTGVVLEPEVVDATKDDEMGTEGDIYSEDEIREAMYWWMENGDSQSAYHHVAKGGEPLGRNDIRLLENWQTRVDQTIGDQLIRKGTWMKSARIYNDNLWNDILSGAITAWSIGANAMASVDSVPA